MMRGEKNRGRRIDDTINRMWRRGEFFYTSTKGENRGRQLLRKNATKMKSDVVRWWYPRQPRVRGGGANGFIRGERTHSSTSLHTGFEKTNYGRGGDE